MTAGIICVTANLPDLSTLKNSGNFSVPTATSQNSMGYINPARDILQAASFYYVTGDEKYKKYAIEGLDRAKDYKPEDYFEFNSLTITPIAGLPVT